MYVTTGDQDPKVAIGNKIDVTGDYEEVNGVSQLSSAVIKVVDPGTKLPFEPVLVDAAKYGSAADKGAAGEPWEAMLCTIKGPIKVSVQNADGEKDYDEFAVNDVKLRVDDQLFDPLGNDYPVGTEFKKITGICAFSFNNRKIWPRVAGDIETADGSTPPPSPGSPDQEPNDLPPPSPGDDDDDNAPTNPAPNKKKPSQDRQDCTAAAPLGTSGGGGLFPLGIAAAVFAMVRRRRRSPSRM
jgi:hypothetical protein